MCSSQSETVFEKRETDGIFTANVKSIKSRLFENDRDLLMSLEKLKQEEFGKLKTDSVHFNNTRFKSSPCMQYDGIFREEGVTSSRFEYFNVRGYICPHPGNANLALQIEFSSLSNSRGFSENSYSLSDEFFANIAFFKPTVKQPTAVNTGRFFISRVRVSNPEHVVRHEPARLSRDGVRMCYRRKFMRYSRFWKRGSERRASENACTLSRNISASRPFLLRPDVRWLLLLAECVNPPPGA